MAYNPFDQFDSPARPSPRERRMGVAIAKEAAYGDTPVSEEEFLKNAVRPPNAFDQFDASAPKAPAASQADVRKAEPPPSPMQAQRENERIFKGATERYMKETGRTGLDIAPSTEPETAAPNEYFTGRRAAPGGVRQMVEQSTGMTDPNKTRDQAGIEELRQGGDVAYGDSALYSIAKFLAAVGGGTVGGVIGSRGGPAGTYAGVSGGATVSEAGVRYVAIAFNLKKAVDAGAITEDRAAEIMEQAMKRGVGEDAAFNFGVPILGQLAAKVPGMRWLAEKVAARLGAIGPKEQEVIQRQAALDNLGKKAEKAADTPAQGAAARQAVQEIGQRTKGEIPTPGQATGEAGFLENSARTVHPRVFERQQQELEDVASGMREGLVNPPKQPSAKALGEAIVKTADDVQRAVKDRLRPAFKAADNLGVTVDLTPVLSAAKAALAKDALVPGGRLAASERADLQALVAQLEQNPHVPAEAALDFASRQKEKLRKTADYEPSSFYDMIVGSLTKTADNAYMQTAASIGREDVAKGLVAARNDYRDMMGTVYKGVIEKALRKEDQLVPEDVGRLIWQAGNVSEIEQLQKMLQIAQREGVMGAGRSTKLMQDVTRGFLQEAVPDLGAAAKWSETLKANPLKRRTWETLTAAPGGSQLRGAMEVLEQAAKIASRGNPELLGQNAILFQRAARGGLGVSYVTGAIHPGFLVAGFSVDALARLMATAYTQGNKGVLNAIARALRANNAGTIAGAKALQETLPEIEKFAAQNGQDDVFVGEQSNGS